jgi:hypothetical protein
MGNGHARGDHGQPAEKLEQIGKHLEVSFMS